MGYTKEEAIHFQNEFRQAEFRISMEQLSEEIHLENSEPNTMEDINIVKAGCRKGYIMYLQDKYPDFHPWIKESR